VIDLRERSIGELLDAAVTISVHNAPLLIALSAVWIVPDFFVSFLRESASTVALPRRDPGYDFAQSALYLVVLVAGAVSQIATAVAVYDLVRGATPRLAAALATGVRTILPAIGVYLRYSLAFILFGGISVASIGGIGTHNPGYVVLGIVGVAAMVVPYALTDLATNLGVIHRGLVARNPEFRNFAGGIAAFSTEGRNVLAAITSLGLQWTGFLAVRLLARILPMPPIASTALEHCVEIVASVVVSTFLTLFYLDLRMRVTGSDLARAAETLMGEATAPALD